MNDKLNKQYYKCYSTKLHQYLQSQGFTITESYIHSETHNTCWVYKLTPALSFSLNQWTNSKPSQL